MRLELCTWQNVRDYLRRSRGILVPIGSLEQHGPNGLLGTDAICAETVARRAGELADALVAPTITVGQAQFNLDFAGTMTLRPTTLIAVVKDYVQSLARSGFTRVYFVNGHGGNLAPLRSAFHEIYADYSLTQGGTSPVWCKVKSWWELPQTDARRKQLYGDSEGYHATPSEIAVTMAAYQDRIVPQAMPKLPPALDDAVITHGGDNYLDAIDHRRRHPDGRVGSDPTLARIEDGRKFIELSAAEIAADYREFLAALPS